MKYTLLTLLIGFLMVAAMGIPAMARKGPATQNSADHDARPDTKHKRHHRHKHNKHHRVSHPHKVAKHLFRQLSGKTT